MRTRSEFVMSPVETSEYYCVVIDFITHTSNVTLPKLLAVDITVNCRLTLKGIRCFLKC